MPSSLRETAISAIETVLHAGTSNDMRMQATQWLEGMVESDDGWTLLMSLLDEKKPDVRMKAAILVKNKIKKTSDRLDQRAANSMAGVIYEKLVQEGTSPSTCAQVIINHLIVSLVLVLVRVPESSANLVPRIANDLSNTPSSLTMILRIIADEITVLRQAIPSHASEEHQHEVFGPIFTLGNTLKSSSRDVLSLVEKSVVEKRITLLEGLKWFSAWVPYLEVEVSASSKFMSCIFGYNKEMQPAEKETIIDSLKALSKKCTVVEHREVVENILKLTAKIASLLEPEAVVGCAAIATNYTSSMVAQIVETGKADFLITFLSTFASKYLSQEGKCEIGEFLSNTTPFWTGIRTASRNINEVSRDVVIRVLREPMLELLRTTMKNFEIDDDHREEDDTNLPCLLRDIAVIIRPGAFIQTVLREIFQGNLSWKPLEARIASLSAVTTVVGIEVWEENSEALCSMLPRVCTPDCHPAIRIAYCSVLHRFSFAFATKPELLRSAVELLLSTKSFKSLNRVSISLGKEMASDPQILKMMCDVWTGLPPNLVTPDGNSTNSVEILSDCLWLVLCKTSLETITVQVSNLLQPVTASINAAYSSGNPGRTCFELEKLQFLIKKSKTWRPLQPSTTVDTHREHVRSLWTGFFEPILNVVFPCLQPIGVPSDIVSASAGCVAGLALVSVSNFQQWQPVLERLQVIASGGDPHPELFSVMTEIARLFSHDVEASKDSVRFLSAFLTSAGSRLNQPGEPGFSDIPLAKALFKMLSELLKKSVIIDGKSKRSHLAIALVAELTIPLIEITCQAMKSSVVLEPELVRHVLQTCDALLLIKPDLATGVNFGPRLTEAAVVAISNKPSEVLGILTKILSNLKKSGGDAFQHWITQAFTTANLGLQASVIQQFTKTITQSSAPSTKPAVEGLFKAVHSQGIYASQPTS
eukprot:TRINITY_DN2111_c0_g2_i1.p1 TRINITY_DN2111_c0_g2~~TRINITY_DN2111_c0_g2_i1.p1  ORF type:complete len:930 (+),score=135.02 TRINITY_DN2111_c0_g2_i1:78-2867(+)